MKQTPKKQSDEYATFSAALKKVLTVSPSELKTRIEKRKRIKTSASRVANERD